MQKNSLLNRTVEKTKKGLEYLLIGGMLFSGGCFKWGKESGSSDTPKDFPPYDGSGYYIDGKKGNDKNMGTFESPWKTIEKANKMLQAGDIVYIRKGTYDESIAPINNGQKNNFITYQNYRYEEPIIRGKKGKIAAINLLKRKYIAVRGVYIRDPPQQYAALSGATGCDIEDCTMEGIGKSSGITLGIYGDDPKTETSYCVIAKNTVYGYPKTTGQEALETLSLFFNAHHNLIEENIFINGDHTLIYVKGSGDGPTKNGEGAHQNVILNNILVNPLHHCIAEGYGAHNNLYEGNEILQSGAEQEGFHLGFTKAIIRFNTVTNSGSIDVKDHLQAGLGFNSRTLRGELYRSEENKVYHNTLAFNPGLAISNSMAVIKPECYEPPLTFTGNNSFINNLITDNGSELSGDYKHVQIIYRSWIAEDCKRKDKEALPIIGDEWRNNLIGTHPQQRVVKIEWHDHNQAHSCLEAESLKNPRFTGNISGYHGFRNAKEGNFELTERSIAIDRGTPLTNATNRGEGDILKVRDSRYFIDGWGVIESDTLQVRETRVRIKSIDYSRNTIELEHAISWSENDPVSLPYHGSAPDMGAFEFGQ